MDTCEVKTRQARACLGRPMLGAWGAAKEAQKAGDAQKAGVLQPVAMIVSKGSTQVVAYQPPLTWDPELDLELDQGEVSVGASSRRLDVSR